MGAIERYQADIQIIACGINYDNGHKFRSTAVIEFGIPYEMPQEKIKQYQNPDMKKGVISDFLDILTKRLLDVKITAANQQDLMLLYLMRDLYLSDEGKVEKEIELRLIRAFKEHYEKHQDSPEMVELKKGLVQYTEDLKYCGVKDWELQTLDTSTFYNILRCIWSLLFVICFCTIVTLD
jgi:glycerol-3-phosphate O-acyltransferase / dihydroxyacetone phosphate acyltransferase